ncbi:MAG TPA: hypothetical protein VLA37_08715 [Sphingomonadaceae bacterium]|nr:hypothetical protein [Sphingomonadaceae bacterium]
MRFWREISPTGAVQDFAAVWRSNPYRWRVLAVSIAATAIFFYVLIPKSERAPPRPFEITYISTFEDGRSDDQILSENVQYQKLKEEREALQQQREQIRRDAAAAIGRATGLDVDSMQREADAEQALEAQELEERRAVAQARAEATLRERNLTVGGQ